jgi:hypothetical protein
MAVKKKALINILQYRYDFQSARTIFNEVITVTGMEEIKDFGPKELKKFVAALKDVGDRLDNVLPRFEELEAAAKPAKKGDDS